jgi:predicted NACHT family NTPase
MPGIDFTEKIESLKSDFDPISALNKVRKYVGEYLAKSHSLKTYPRNLQHRYGKLTIQGLKGCNSIDLLDIFVEQNATEVFDVGQSDECQEDDNQGSQEEDDNQEFQKNDNSDWSKKSESVLNILREENYRCVVIVGDPGSGKSTLVRY